MADHPTFPDGHPTHSAADPALTTGGEASPTVAAAPPAAAGRYALGEEIARGGMGAVYRATDAAFGREVAVKVLLEKYAPASGAARRFADEARITGQLQHPGIPPAHDLGTLPDGRPFLAMKLIKGDTLDDLLKAGPAAADRGRLVAAFEGVCQAVAYAHAHGVVHRDLKPANVMVGSFGEVQVMDWGLAKVLGASRERERPEDPDATAAATAVVSVRDNEELLTQAGAVLGTPAYMPPEQALGAVHEVDARSDVFGLGGILAAILTGRPPFVGETAETTRLLAAKGKVGDCFARLDGCGADPGLVALCKRCLAPEKDDRPADAGAVAAAVAGLRQAADDRARRAELDRVQAEAKAAEQRKRRKVQLALAAAVGLMLLGGGAFAWWQDRQARERENERALAADRDRQGAEAALAQAETALERGDLVAADAALEQARNRVGEAGPADLRERLAAATRDRDVAVELERLADRDWKVVAQGGGRVGLTYGKEHYPRVLAAYGVDPADPATAAEVVRGSRVGWALTAGLAEWFRADPGRPGLREFLDRLDPDPRRVEFRAAVAAGDDKRVRALAATVDGAAVPAWFAVLVSGQRTVTAEDAVRVRGAAWRVHPGYYPLAYGLRSLLEDQGPDRLDEAIGWARTAVSLRPGSSVAYNSLGVLLGRKGDMAGAEVCIRNAVEIDPMDARAQNNLGWLLGLNRDTAGAEKCYRKAIELDPRLTKAHAGLGWALSKQGKSAEAEKCYRRAIELDPKDADAYQGLGDVGRDRRDWAGAEGWYRKAIELDPKNARAHRGLGSLRADQGDWVGAEGWHRKAIELDPKLSDAHNSLGWALFNQGKPAEAETCYRKAIELHPKNADPHHNQGVLLSSQGDFAGAEVSVRRAIELDPMHRQAHAILGYVLQQMGNLDGAIAEYREAIRIDPKQEFARLYLPRAERMRELLSRLPDVLAGKVEPATPAEACEFARLCAQSFQKRYAAAARLYAEAFTLDPALVRDWRAAHAYYATAAAARAARGDGVDAPADAADRAALRARALAWLRGFLAIRKNQAASNNAAVRSEAIRALAFWLGDPDLSAVRHPWLLAGLPAAEANDWLAFWADVRTTLAEAKKPPSPPELAPPPRPK